MPTRDPTILIVGAGPTGLVLALSLARRGVPFRLIERHAGPAQASRAMVVQARTLEFYQQLGIAEAVVARGIPVEQFHFRRHGVDAAQVRLGEIGHGLSPYPFLLCFPQDNHERFLVEELDAAGIRVEWSTELVQLEQDDARVLARIRGPSGEEQEFEFAYVCGCDGSHSAVRTSLGVGFAGGTSEGLFYVADVELEGEFTTDVYANIDERGIAMNFPIRPGQQRLIGTVPEQLADRDDLQFDDLRPSVEALLGVATRQLHWFSTYKVSHRVADQFHVGRCFLAGDAGHIHSPVGGQGMNTGIGDAFNLAWKLADVVTGRADPKLLDSYEPERLPFARSLVKSTDEAFERISSKSAFGSFVRSYVAPNAVHLLSMFDISRRMLFRTISQIRIQYRDSPLSEGAAGDVAGGDRLPWIGDEVDNFAPLASLDWQLHVIGEVEPAFVEAATSAAIPIHTFVWTQSYAAHGFTKHGAYLVRPDGHVGLAMDHQDPAGLTAYADHWGLTRSRPAG